MRLTDRAGTFFTLYLRYTNTAEWIHAFSDALLVVLTGQYRVLARVALDVFDHGLVVLSLTVAVVWVCVVALVVLVIVVVGPLLSLVACSRSAA